MHAVILSSAADAANWLGITRWIEAICGPPGEDWDSGDTEDAQTVYLFRHKKHAEQFDKTWANFPLILPYKLWEEFCINDLARARMETYWSQCSWRPTTIVFAPQLKKASSVQGGNRRYWPSYKLWFFETHTDALLFWIEHYE